MEDSNGATPEIWPLVLCVVIIVIFAKIIAGLLTL